MVAQGKAEGGNGAEVGVADVLYIMENNKVLPYSTGNYFQYSMISPMEKNSCVSCLALHKPSLLQSPHFGIVWPHCACRVHGLAVREAYSMPILTPDRQNYLVFY